MIVLAAWSCRMLNNKKTLFKHILVNESNTTYMFLDIAPYGSTVFQVVCHWTFQYDVKGLDALRQTWKHRHI